jgi:D-hexose-6-phosphate mutarotase
LYNTEECAGVRFGLNLANVQDGLGSDNDWVNDRYSCTLVLTVEFTARTMTTTLEIQNTGTIAFPFQALQNMYFHIVDQAALQPDKCFVTGLKGYTVSDKVTKAQPHVNEMEKIVIDGEVDQVYDPLQNGLKNDVNVMLWEWWMESMFLSCVLTVGQLLAQVSPVV